MDKVDKIIWGTFGSILIIFAVYIGRSIYAKNQCLSYGYPTASVTFDLTAYCIKRVDQTDEVVRLRNLQ